MLLALENPQLRLRNNELAAPLDFVSLYPADRALSSVRNFSARIPDVYYPRTAALLGKFFSVITQTSLCLVLVSLHKRKTWNDIDKYKPQDPTATIESNVRRSSWETRHVSRNNVLVLTVWESADLPLAAQCFHSSVLLTREFFCSFS